MPTQLELETEVRNLLDEPVAAQWTQPMIRTWLNEGNRDLARTTRHYKGTKTITPINGTAEYTVDVDSLSRGVIAVEHAYYWDGSRDWPLEPRHYENMDQVWGADRSRTGVRPVFFTTWGNQPTLKLRLFPVPTFGAPHEIRLLVAVLPTMMALSGGDGTQVDVPPAWYDALADYCEYKALRRDRDPRWQEARTAYMDTRDALVHNVDYITVNREMIPAPGIGYLPKWLVEPEGW